MMQMLIISIFIVAVAAGIVPTSPELISKKHAEWTPWSTCSTSCGYGEQRRYRKPSPDSNSNETETRFCMTQFCPSYLSWPRFHFFGNIFTDIPTMNNLRCRYDLKRFIIATASTNHNNSNPDGSGQIYFTGMKIGSLCKSPGECTQSDFINNVGFGETKHATFADIDTDWQHTTEIYGLSITVEKIFHAKFSRVSCRAVRTRVNGESGDRSRSVTYKSKLTNIKWKKPKYQRLFNNASELSMTFVLDMHDGNLLLSRVSGTVGLTSSDDPRQTVGTRVMRGTGPYSGVGFAPFFIHYDLKYLTLDLSNAVKIDHMYGGYHFIKFDSMDLAILLNSKTYCRYFRKSPNCGTNYVPKQKIFHRLTNGGLISKWLKAGDNDWYKIYGGVLDISLKHLDESTLNLMKDNRLAIVYPDRSDETKLLTTHLESLFGIQSGVTGPSAHKLSPGETESMEVFVSSFGKPAVGVEVEVKSFSRLADKDCPFYCNRTLGSPKDALSIEPMRLPATTDSRGIIKFKLHAAFGPGSPRGCGLDGQLYPLQILVKYDSGSKVIVFEEGSNRKVKAPNIDITAVHTVAKVYDDVEDITCPTWLDVKDIFELYYNMYPIMWKNNMINLRSYEDVKGRARMLKAAMFDFDVESPRFMPVTRDLSYGKRRLIWNWMKCGLKKGDEQKPEKNENLCQDLDHQLKLLKNDLKNAVFVEFSTIPPYYTAWLSVKSHEGRNKEVSNIVKTIFRDEMKHMSLASNLLNSIGGKMKISKNRPTYPCPLSYGSFYGLEEGTLLSLGPMSIGVINDVFCAIERPVMDSGKKVLSKIATLWRILCKDAYNCTTDEFNSKLIQYFLEDYSTNVTSYREDAHNQNREDREGSSNGRDQSEKKAWESILKFAHQELKIGEQLHLHTVNAFYTQLALRMAYMESCTKLGYANITSEQASLGTIFIGKGSSQLNQSNWFQRSSSPHEAMCVVKDVSRTMGDFPPVGWKVKGNNTVKTQFPIEDCIMDHAAAKDNYMPISNTLFPVTNLASALRAVVEIAYQGEGGSGCSPFEELEEGDSNTLSHYYRFQQIVHGRRLIRVPEHEVKPTDKCVNFSDWCHQFNKGWSYCYAGEPITFYEDGVWPILSDPSIFTYLPGTKAYMLDRRFSLVYVNMMLCLDEVLSGNPDRMKYCMTYMYDLTMIGRQLVSTPVEFLNGTAEQRIPTSKYATPSFGFFKEV